VTYALLTKVVWKVGDHDLGLAGNAVLGWAALLARLASLVGGDGALLAGLGGQSLVGGGCQWIGLAGDVGGSVDTLLAIGLAASAGSTAGTSTTAATTTGAVTAAVALTALGGLGGWCGWLRLAGELDGHLAVEDGLAVQVLDGALGLGGSGYVNKGVTDGTSGARVGWD
jgi:hypothetical protein